MISISPLNETAKAMPKDQTVVIPSESNRQSDEKRK
jgi:hypothetical protein